MNEPLLATFPISSSSRMAGDVLSEEISETATQPEVCDGTGTPVELPHESSLAISCSAEDIQFAQRLANLLDTYRRLRREEHMTVIGAAEFLGKPASLFSGSDSALARYERGGLAGLLPEVRETTAGDLTQRIEALRWFIVAGRFFYANTNLQRERGSVPESIRRVISLPDLPQGWRKDTRWRFAQVLKKAGFTEIPTCPPELRTEILDRERIGQPLVPHRIARQISLSRAVMRQRRNPTDTALDYLSAPGSLFFFIDPVTGERRPPVCGEVIEADDATINFPVCVPWSLGGDPCSERYGVKVGRFQWLVAIDAARRYVTAWSYVMRPRSSYRAEDALTLMRAHCLQHGIPLEWRFERGVWKSNLVKRAVEAMGSHLHTVWSPHQKPYIEGLFNSLWTKLSVQFPDSDVGRFRGESEEASDLLTACQRGHQDPRKYFPMLADAVAAFGQVIHEKNQTPVSSDIGRWIPAEAWAARSDTTRATCSQIRRFDAESEWIFAPYIREWTVSGMNVGGKVRLFEDLSIPLDFTATWLVHYKGARVRLHFDPTAPNCFATIVLLERWPGPDGKPRSPGQILGVAKQMNNVGEYARFVLGWASSPDTAGRLARQQAAAALRRETRAVVGDNRGYRTSEERDGVSLITKLETDQVPCVPPVPSVPDQPDAQFLSDRLSAADAWEKEHALEFL